MVVRERQASATKPAKVRICLDPSQTVNKAIIRPVYPIPTLEENIHRFNQAKVFSTFDIKDAFQAITLTKESSMMTTMHAPWGRYRWTRLPFGISSAQRNSSVVSTMFSVAWMKSSTLLMTLSSWGGANIHRQLFMIMVKTCSHCYGVRHSTSSNSTQTRSSSYSTIHGPHTYH